MVECEREGVLLEMLALSETPRSADVDWAEVVPVSVAKVGSDASPPPRTLLGDSPTAHVSAYDHADMQR